MPEPMSTNEPSSRGRASDRMRRVSGRALVALYLAECTLSADAVSSESRSTQPIVSVPYRRSKGDRRGRCPRSSRSSPDPSLALANAHRTGFMTLGRPPGSRPHAMRRRQGRALAAARTVARPASIQAVDQRRYWIRFVWRRLTR